MLWKASKRRCYATTDMTKRAYFWHEERAEHCSAFCVNNMETEVSLIHPKQPVQALNQSKSVETREKFSRVIIAWGVARTSLGILSDFPEKPWTGRQHGCHAWPFCFLWLLPRQLCLKLPKIWLLWCRCSTLHTRYAIILPVDPGWSSASAQSELYSAIAIGCIHFSPPTQLAVPGSQRPGRRGTIVVKMIWTNVLCRG
jgi:hypothetical protein